MEFRLPNTKMPSPSTAASLIMCLSSLTLALGNPGKLPRRISQSKSRWLFEQLVPASESEAAQEGHRLVETPGSVFDPPPDQLHPYDLRKKLGKMFDSDFMSVQRPLDSHWHPEGVVEFPYRKNKHGKIRPQKGVSTNEIDELDIEHLLLPDGTVEETKVGSKLERKFKKLLWAFTYCPVLYQWKDLGVRFWPRWIKLGMTCQPKKDGFLNKLILRWHCRDWNHRQGCQWISVNYTIISECECRCSSGA
ncbi:unnamed protein product [Cyprideis torosa]|uniref:Uncharacterized protein n=1 Tax=Cyprideis torosa TaxID=163714 RepID=A0A7R8ZQT1_9CRUS|nr:unnamed protein product [Cyprideis torosa]CAG0891407.1 unnamed protein product [Cyprideis torosa]